MQHQVPHAASRLALTFALVLAAGCSGGGSGGQPALGTPATGRFADPPVEGLTYTTASGSGVTASDGSFQYLTGETITFSLGDVVLGSAVPAKSKMNAFDLVPGATEPVSAFDTRRLRMQWASRGPDPDLLLAYEAINILSFLHSYDEDKDSTNGILLEPGLSALFAGTTIEFARPTFHYLQRERAASERLYRAFDQGLVVSARRVHPYQAFDRHCAAEGLVPDLWLETHDEYDAGNNGSIDSIQWWTMDSRGFRIDETGDTNANGTPDYQEFFTFDDFGMVLTALRDNDGNSTLDRAEYHVYDVHGNQVRLEIDSDGGGAIDRVTYFTYDTEGREARVENDFDADGVMDSVSFSTYDKPGRRSRLENDTNADGSIDTIDSWTYDDDDNLLTFEQDGNGDGLPEARTTYEYDLAGNPTREERDHDANGTIDMIVVRTWSSHGDMLTEQWDYTADGSLDLVITRTYDARRRVTRYEQDNGANGTIDDVSVYRYVDTAEGLEMLQEHDYGDDGSINYRARQRWGSEGRQIGYDTDINGDGLYDNSQSMIQTRATFLGTILGD